jgi:hypothetical protein
VAPLVRELETWMRGARTKMSRHSEVAKAMDYVQGGDKPGQWSGGMVLARAE